MPGMYNVSFPDRGYVKIPYSHEGYAMKLAEDEYKARLAESIKERSERQRYAESAYNDSASSPVGAMGAYQIMPKTLDEYVTATGDQGDINDYAYNKRVRDWYIDKLSKSGTVSRGNPSDDVKLAKIYAAYNWGVGNLGKYLQGLKDSGVDIYHSMGWVDGLPKEARDYVNFIVRGIDTPGTSKTEKSYQDARRKYYGISDDTTDKDYALPEQEPLVMLLKDGPAYTESYLDNSFSGFGGTFLKNYNSGGKIHIKESKRGTFTEAAKRHGKSVQAFASQVLANKDNYSSAMVKKANFARNAARWHAEGGLLDRMNKLYGSDVGKMLEVINKIKAGNK